MSGTGDSKSASETTGSSGNPQAMMPSQYSMSGFTFSAKPWREIPRTSTLTPMAASLAGFFLSSGLQRGQRECTSGLNPHSGQPGPLTCHNAQIRHRHDQHLLQLADVADIICIGKFIVCFTFPRVGEKRIAHQLSWPVIGYVTAAIHPVNGNPFCFNCSSPHSKFSAWPFLPNVYTWGCSSKSNVGGRFPSQFPPHIHPVISRRVRNRSSQEQ